MSKSTKPEKLISTKKLPSLLKKKYTEKNFEKKILKKIYIEEDKNYLKSLFVENGKTKKDVQLYAIPQEKEFSKTEITRLKSLAKEIKKQKGRVKLVPLFAVLIFIAVIVVFTLFFKNKIIKTVIINAVQNSTETRCDIEYLNLSIFDATFNLRGFAVADKKDPMKNTVSVDNVNIDFNMLELLKKKFIANDICVTGFELNSDRKYTGELSSAELKKIHIKKEKKAEKERIKEEKKRLKKSQPKKESALAKQIKANAGKAADNVKDSVSEIFAPYNPETMFSNMFNSLKTPPLADIVKTDVEKYTAKYQTFPAELETDVNTAKGIVDSIQSINIEELKKDPLKIKDTIELLTKSYNEVVTLTEKTQKKINDIQKDVDAVSKLSKAIQDGITSDTDYVKKEVSKLTSIKLDDGMKFVSGSFSTILYNLLGNYYPYYEKGTELLETIKNNKKEKTPKKKTTVSKRSPGRNIYYTVDPNPTLWIKNLEGSGGTISFKVTDITNDMDKTADTTKAIVAFSAAGITHNADLIFDTRKTSDAPLVFADYTCSNVPFSYSAEKLGNVPGIPGIDSSKGKIGLKFNIFDEENFDIDGNIDLAELKLSAQSFSPEFVSVIYNNVLEGINKMTASVQVANTSEKGFNLNFNSDIDKVFLTSLEKEMSEELDKLKKQVEEELVKKINEYTDGALGEIQNFTDLKNQIYDYKNQIDNFSGEVQKKLSDAEGLLKNTVDEAEKALKKAADDAKKQAEEEAKKMLEEAEKKAKEELQKKQDEAKAEAEKALKEAEEKAKKKAAEEAKKALKMLF